MKEVFLHIKLIEQASGDDHPAIFIQQTSDEEVQGCVFKLTFACNSSFSWSAMSGALDSASICCKKIQIFEKKGFTLGIILFLVQSAQDKFFKSHIESALKSALRKPKTTTVKLPFGLCGCQEESTKGRDFGEIEEEPSEQTHRNGIENPNARIQLPMPLPSSSFVILVDEWQTIQSGADEIGKWLLNSDSLEFIDQIAPNSFKGVYKGKRVGIEKLKGCDKGNSYEFELRKDLLELMTCGHRNILQFYGVCVDENNGLCVVTKLMEGGSVHDLMLKNKKLQIKEIMRIAADVAEGIKFMNDHGVAYKDLNTQRILLDKHGNACLADMGIVTACKSVSEAMEYETDGYRWLAPEVCITLLFFELMSGHNLILSPPQVHKFYLPMLVITHNHHAWSTSSITRSSYSKLVHLNRPIQQLIYHLCGTQIDFSCFYVMFLWFSVCGYSCYC